MISAVTNGRVIVSLAAVLVIAILILCQDKIMKNVLAWCLVRRMNTGVAQGWQPEPKLQMELRDCGYTPDERGRYHWHWN